MSVPRSASATAGPSGTMPSLQPSQPRSSSVQAIPPGSSAPGQAADLQRTLSKLQQENHSLKRRLVQYASTLEQVTSHAKREISSSARARDDAIAAAADAASLRQKTLELTTARDRADRAARDAHAALSDRSSSLSRATEEIARLRSRLADSDADKAALREARDSAAVAERRIIAAEAEARANADRVAALEARASEVSDRALSADRLSRQLAEVARHRDDLADRADRVSREVSAAEMRDAQARAEIARLKEEIERHERDATSHRTLLDQHSRSEAAAEERYRIAETNIAKLNEKLELVQSQANETAAALRKELDEALKETANRNAELSEFREQATREFEATEAVEERDLLRINVRDLQEELEQSSEMLTRAAIDALGDKSKIRKLEEALGKAREELTVERRERISRDSKISGLNEEISAFEKQLDSLRAAKRSLTEECHRFQMQLHDRDNVIVTKSKELEKVSSERSDRAFHADRVSLELSNVKNGLAKKESDLMTLNAQFEELNEEFKTVSKDLQDRQDEIGHVRRELSSATDQLSVVNNEKDRLQSQVAELQSTRRKVQDLTSTLSEKEEELSTVKRWYASLKTEMNESAREKKRLSDMLAEVSSDLQRANHELDLLRTVRKDQEALAARIAHIGETSSRELNIMKQSQTEQAERLARNTVEEYQRRLEEMQSTAKDDIAQSVAAQLRHDIMPHLMRVVDSKARGMVHALARHVESFAVDDVDPSYGSSRLDYSLSREGDIGGRAESSNTADTNVATASRSSAGVAQPSSMAASESMAVSGYRSGGMSYPQSHAPASTADSRWNSVLEASRVESVSGSLGRDLGASREALQSPDPSVGPSTGLTDISVDSNTEGKSDEGDDTVQLPDASRAAPSTDVSESADGQNASPEGSPVVTQDAGSLKSREVPLGFAGGPSESVQLPGGSEGEEEDDEDRVEDNEGEGLAEGPEHDIDDHEASDLGVTEQSEEPSNSISEDVSQLYSEDQPRDEGDSQGQEHVGPGGESDYGPDSEGKQGEDIEEIDITEHRGDDDEDDDDVGVDIEVEFDPRDLLQKGLFSAMVDGLEIVAEPDDDYDNYGHVEDNYDEGGPSGEEETGDDGHEEDLSEGDPINDREDGEDPANGEPPVLSEDPEEVAESVEEVDHEQSDTHDSEVLEEHEPEHDSASRDIDLTAGGANVAEESEDVSMSSARGEEDTEVKDEGDGSAALDPLPDTPDTASGDEPLDKSRELDELDKTVDEDADHGDDGEVSGPDESEVRELEDRDDEDTLGEDADYSGEHEVEGAGDDEAPDSERVSGERVNVVDDAFTQAGETFQEMSEELRAVYQAYYTSGRGSSLSGPPTLAQVVEPLPLAGTTDGTEDPEGESVPGMSDVEVTDMDKLPEGPTGEEGISGDGNENSDHDQSDSREYDAGPVDGEEMDENVNSGSSTVGATEEHGGGAENDSEQAPPSTEQLSLDDDLTEGGGLENLYDQSVSEGTVPDEPESQVTHTDDTMHDQDESMHGDEGLHDDQYDDEDGEEHFDEHDDGEDYHDDGEDYHDDDYHDDAYPIDDYGDEDYHGMEHREGDDETEGDGDDDLHQGDLSEHSESVDHGVHPEPKPSVTSSTATN